MWGQGSRDKSQLLPAPALPMPLRSQLLPAHPQGPEKGTVGAQAQGSNVGHIPTQDPIPPMHGTGCTYYPSLCGDISLLGWGQRLMPVVAFPALGVGVGDKALRPYAPTRTRRPQAGQEKSMPSPSASPPWAGRDKTRGTEEEPVPRPTHPKHLGDIYGRTGGRDPGYLLGWRG